LEVHDHQREQESIVGGVEKEHFVGGVDRINGARRFDSLTNSSPIRAWISGRDPLLVVSIVTAQKNPLLYLFVLLFFVHHHASITLHTFAKPKIIWNKLYFKSL
jgi:hypothetical protein